MKKFSSSLCIFLLGMLFGVVSFNEFLVKPGIAQLHGSVKLANVEIKKYVAAKEEETKDLKRALTLSIKLIGLFSKEIVPQAEPPTEADPMSNKDKIKQTAEELLPLLKKLDGVPTTQSATQPATRPTPSSSADLARAMTEHPTSPARVDSMNRRPDAGFLRR